MSHHRPHSIPALGLPLFTTIVLAGCAAPLYQEPTSGPTAKIEFIDKTPQPMSLHLHGGVKECTDRINVGGVAAGTSRTVTIQAGQKQVFTVGVNSENANFEVFGKIGLAVGLRGSGYVLRERPCYTTECLNKRQVFLGCAPTIDFLPEAGRSYVFQMDSNDKSCQYQFYAKPLAGQTEPEFAQIPFSERQWIRAFGEAGPFCKPQ